MSFQMESSEDDGLEDVAAAVEDEALASTEGAEKAEAVKAKDPKYNQSTKIQRKVGSRRRLRWNGVFMGDEVCEARSLAAVYVNRAGY